MTPRQAAIAAGAKRYFTGRPCKHGHVCERFVSSNACTQCTRERAADYDKANPEMARAREARRDRSAYYPAHKERILARTKEWAAANAGRVAEAAKARRLRRLDDAKVVARAWRDANRAHRNAKRMARKAAELAATPAWADPSKIVEFYETAQGLSMLTGEWHHVDHIVPLMGKMVCGLHVEHNLRVIQAPENWAKNNRHWPGMP